MQDIKDELIDENEIFVEFDGTMIKKSSFKRLEKKGLLDTECMSYFMSLLQKRNLQSKTQKPMNFCHSIFYQQLEKSGPNAVIGYFQNIKIFNLECMYVPIH